MLKLPLLGAFIFSLGSVFLQLSTASASTYFTNQCTYEMRRAGSVLEPGSSEELTKLCVERALARKSHNMRNELRNSIAWCRSERPKAVSGCLREIFKDNEKFEAAFKAGEAINRTQRQQRGGLYGQNSSRGSGSTGPRDLTGAITQRVGAVLRGKTVADLSVGSLRPGIPFQKARAIAEKEWAFSGGAAVDLFKEFTPTRRQQSAYKQRYGRDGGWLKFATMSGKVGEVIFIEHYAGKMNPGAFQSEVIKRYGKPDRQQQNGKALEMAWEKGDQQLFITVGNRIAEISRSRQGYWSSVVVALRSEEYSEYLEKARRHCARLRDKPASRLSTNDKIALSRKCLTP